MVHAVGVTPDAWRGSPPGRNGPRRGCEVGKSVPARSKAAGKTAAASGSGDNGAAAASKNGAVNGSGTRLVIVESPAKARTIAGYLG